MYSFCIFCGLCFSLLFENARDITTDIRKTDSTVELPPPMCNHRTRYPFAPSPPHIDPLHPRDNEVVSIPASGHTPFSFNARMYKRGYRHVKYSDQSYPDEKFNNVDYFEKFTGSSNICRFPSLPRSIHPVAVVLGSKINIIILTLDPNFARSSFFILFLLLIQFCSNSYLQ